MLPTPHPEVLAYDWLPPVVLGREVEVAELVRQLDAPRPRAPAPWMAAAVGPRGCGTSAVARRAAREVADRVRASGAVRPPRWIAVRTAQYRGTHGVATALLHAMDDGFDGRGFPVVEILAGMYLEAKIDTGIIEGIEDRPPARCELGECGLDQAGWALRPGIDIGPGQCAGKSGMRLEAKTCRRLGCEQQLLHRPSLS